MKIEWMKQELATAELSAENAWKQYDKAPSSRKLFWEGIAVAFEGMAEHFRSEIRLASPAPQIVGPVIPLKKKVQLVS